MLPRGSGDADQVQRESELHAGTKGGPANGQASEIPLNGGGRKREAFLID